MSVGYSSGNCEKRVENGSNSNYKIMCHLKDLQDDQDILRKGFFFFYIIKLVEHEHLGKRYDSLE